MKAMFEDDEDDKKKESKKDKVEGQDEVEIEESEDVKADGDGSGHSKPGEANKTKLGGVGKETEAAEPAEPVKRLDFSLLDQMTSFLYSDEDPLPILCGYFNKIMQQLLIKQKNNILEYLLVE